MEAVQMMQNVTDFSIDYNPYLLKYAFLKDGKGLNSGNRIVSKAENKRLQVLLSRNENWKGLLEEISNACNDTNIRLTFRGRKIDFEDLEYAYKKEYSGDSNFELILEEVRNDKDIMSELDAWFDEIRLSDIEDFQETKDGKSIFDVYEEAKNGIFNISVIATMSSGKSTLLNSLLHTELLPSKNQACTATVARILDNDDMEGKGYVATCYDADEKTIVYPKALVTQKLMEKYNEDEKVTYIDIEGQIPAISSEGIRVCLRDTPGPNNTGDERHGELTNHIIRETNAIVMYVMNATQLEIEDDKNLLENISEQMKRSGKESRDRFIFILNKSDEIDEEKEPIGTVLEKCRNYLMKFGIDDPIIIPISALAALIIRKNRRGEKLTRKEDTIYSSLKDFVKYPDLHFENYATVSPTIRQKLVKQITDFQKDKEMLEQEAEIHTGVPAVEETIKEFLEKYAFPIKISDAIQDARKILEHIDMTGKFNKSISESEEKRKAIEEQIQQAIVKRQSSRFTVEEFERKLDEFNIEDADEIEQSDKISDIFSKITAPYRRTGTTEKTEADRMINVFVAKLQQEEKQCGERLNRFLDEKIYKNGQAMLEEYENTIQEIFNDIVIEGYEFKKNKEFRSVHIADIEGLKKKYTKDHLREETRCCPAN